MSEIVKADDQQSQVLGIIASAASNPDVDVQKMQQLLDMQKDVFDKQAQMAYMQSMQKVQSEMPAITKAAQNTQTGSKYAKLEHINSKLVPVYTRHGFSLTFGSKPAADGFLCVTCKIFHVGGHHQEEELAMAIDDTGIKGTKNKTQAHGSGSAVSYCRRYLTTMIFNIVLTDEDNDSQVYVTPQQVEEMQTLVDNYGVDMDKFLSFLKVPNLEALPAIKYGKAKSALEAKR